MDFIYLFRVLLKRKWIIIFSGVLAAALAYYLTKNEPKKYLSRAQISTGFTINDEIKVGNENFNFIETDSKFMNAVVTLTSTPVISLLADTLILYDLQSPKPFRNLKEDQKQSQVYKQINKAEAINVFRNKLENMNMLTSFKPDEKKLLEFLKLYGYDYSAIGKNLNAYQLQRTDYIQIDFFSENPELSAFVVNNIFHQFLRYYQGIRRGKSQESIDTLKSLMEKKKQEWEAKNALLRGEGVFSTEEANSSAGDLISNLEQTLTDEKGKRIKLYSELQKVNKKISDLGQAVPKNINQNDEVLILRNEMDQAYRDYANSWPPDKGLLEKYNNLKTQYQIKFSESNQTVNKGNKSDVTDLLEKKSDLEIDIDAANTLVNSIQSKINSAKGSVVKSTSVESLINEVTQANKDYLAAKKKYDDALDINGSSVNNFRQVLVGQPAIEPETSKRKLIVGMAGVAAIITVILFIILLTYLDSSVKTPAIFTKTVNLKLISMVNFMNLKKKTLAEIVAKKDITNDPKEKKRHNAFRESLRKLRYEIETSGKKIFLFSSTRKGEGKTTLIQALSYSMSLSKKKILIIDTNFCNNDLTVQLNAEPVLEKISLNTTNGETLLEQIKEVSKDIGVGTVFAIGSEGGDYTPSEILPRNNLLEHLQTLTQEFDYIFLEGPPLNDFSDSKELAKYVDGVIAVFSADHIIKQIDRESILFYNELNGKFSGAVLNMVDLNNMNVT